MIDAGFHFTDDHTLKSALDSFDFLETLDLQTDIGQNPSYLPSRKVDIDVTFEPVIRNIHSVSI